MQPTCQTLWVKGCVVRRSHEGSLVRERSMGDSLVSERGRRRARPTRRDRSGG
ncbi:MAG: hypothetical protein ABEI75_00815 [Halobaculum sp.]